MLNYKKYNFFYNSIINFESNNIYYYLVLDKKNFDYIYVIYNMKSNEIIKYIYILNVIYIFYMYKNIFYLLFKIYKHIFLHNIKIKYERYKIILNIIGINYKLYYLNKYNLIIFKLKYNHKIIIKIPRLVYCKVDKNLLFLFSVDLFILCYVSKLINSFQYINKYKDLGIKML
ncbi:large subunit ribosomal protein 6 (apicoplast) [Plasmodium gonderi]|uniref:Large subunit ribosomal protein 6 n=1 Tax=Plasmodium gonderi TaxID=77519 RepID=A0A1Y1JVK2_PLAGO|nr:large subunit ribosomal protein 6 [Plasmodium gonderi]BBB58255.1 large subunit ribosomal protein 6 [Plasmodium gonderi]GAW84752.1 large subunit ribosomal protein 6 [Plasmodium gonderi]